MRLDFRRVATDAGKLVIEEIVAAREPIGRRLDLDVGRRRDAREDQKDGGDGHENEGKHKPARPPRLRYAEPT